MPAATAASPDQSYRLDLLARGYTVLFRADETNRCPGCGRTHWYVGRITAECGFCGTAIPLAESVQEELGRRAVALHVIDGGEAANPIERRREPRVPCDGRVISLHVDGAPRPFALQNISSGGVMGEALAGLREARSLVVELEDGTLLPAELRWSDGDNAGLAFVRAA